MQQINKPEVIKNREQDSRSATMKDMAKDLAKRGLLTLSLGRMALVSKH